MNYLGLSNHFFLSFIQVWDAVKAIVRYEMRKQNKQLGSPPFGASNRNTDASAPSSDRLGLGAKSARDIILATPPKNSYQFERRKHQEVCLMSETWQISHVYTICCYRRISDTKHHLRICVIQIVLALKREHPLNNCKLTVS